MSWQKIYPVKSVDVFEPLLEVLNLKYLFGTRRRRWKQIKLLFFLILLWSWNKSVYYDEILQGCCCQVRLLWLLICHLHHSFCCRLFLKSKPFYKYCNEEYRQSSIGVATILSYLFNVTIKVKFRHPSVNPDKRYFDTEMRYGALLWLDIGGYLRFSVSSLVRSVNIVGIQFSLVIRGGYVPSFCTGNTRIADKKSYFDLKNDILDQFWQCE